jgi:transposase
MAKGYRPVDRDQAFLFPPDMREWLPRDHPVHVVIEVVERMDTAVFHARRKTGGAGTAGYDPDMLLTVLVWAYANRVTSSRRMEELCRTDVAFRLICAGNLPDHCTLARFRQQFPDAAAGFFAQVLILCGRLGMGRLGVVALDGMKIAASASKAANRTHKRLRKLAEEAVAAHAAADAAEDELFGEGRRGDELPPDEGAGGWSPRRRGERIDEALAQLEAESKAAQAGRDAKAAQFRARQEAGRRTGPSTAGAEVALALENLARVTAAREAQLAELGRRQAAGAPRRAQAGVEDYCRVRRAAAKVERARKRAAEAQARAAAKAGPGPVRNITDPDSRLMPTRNGFIQGYNAQNVTSEDGLVIATELTDDPVDMAWWEPMMERAAAAAALIAAHRPAPAGGQDPGSGPAGIGLVLADAGYCSEQNLTCAGPGRLIAVGKRRDLEKAARDSGAEDPGWGGPAIRDMRARLKTEDGITAYRQRGHIAETPHGHIKHNMGFRQLSVRGKDRAAAEWTFACAVHNLFKALTAGRLTPQALAALAG